MSESGGRMNRWALGLSGGMLLVSGLLALAGNMELAGAGFLLVFVLLLIGMWRHRLLHGFMFTVWVLTAVVVALIYPDSLTQFGGINTEILIVPLIQIIMFGMGTAMSLGDFAGVLRMPRGVLIGLGCQFTIMPLVGLLLVTLTGFPPEIAAGILLIGCSPSGVSSNVMAFISKGNLALSVTLTACATLLAPLLTPLLCWGWPTVWCPSNSCP
ncbi:MAG: bile acid:sodium symporter family protein [Bacteroidota bacterium]